MDDELFWSAMVNLPFHAMRIPEVFLAPGPEGARASKIQAPADLLTQVRASAGARPAHLAAGQGAVVYRVDGDLLRNETNRYRAMAEAAFRDETPRFINIGDAIFGEFLGAGWDPATDGHRSMRRAASLAIGGPRGAGGSLYIGVFRTGDFGLRLSIDGAAAPLALVYRDNGSFGVPRAAGGRRHRPARSEIIAGHGSRRAADIRLRGDPVACRCSALRNESRDKCDKES